MPGLTEDYSGSMVLYALKFVCCQGDQQVCGVQLRIIGFLVHTVSGIVCLPC